MRVKLFLIRHGQTSWNEEGRYQGNKDTNLTRLGIKQAKLVAKYLSRVDFSNIYSSPLKRALHTANIINKNRSSRIIIRENLREIYFGKWEGMKINEINQKYNEDYKNWLNDPFNNSPTQGESFKELTIRTVKEIENIINENNDNSNIAVVSHGGAILSLLIYWLKIPVSRWKSIIQRGGSISVVIIDKGSPYISTLNFTGHLKKIYDEREDRVLEIYGRLTNKNNN
jgi:probable phosphoglycerate mutase